MTPFEKNNNYSATYDEVIRYYEALDADHEHMQLSTFGMTDVGRPLHEIVVSADKTFTPEAAGNKLILFINNGIHPGEPCGIDASMMLIRDILADSKRLALLRDVVLVVVPVYNIDGALNRNSHTRTNQLGPEAYGFRGNAQNLDLNRDFVKCDSRNAQSFNQYFQKWRPHVMVDTHTSNGADYTYTMTLIATQKDKLASPLSKYLEEKMLPRLYADMKEADWEMIPYVYSRESPHEGIAGFLDYARYSSGYAAQFNTISFMPETHMLKSFEARVRSTYALLNSFVHTVKDHRGEILDARRKADEQIKSQPTFDLDWAIDFDESERLTFKGYAAKYKPSAVTGQSRLYYDQNDPYEAEVPFFNTYKPTLTIEKPIAYIIPQAYARVIERLKWNGVEMQQLESDKTIEVEMYRIISFEDQKAYEGHYLHKKVQVEKSTQDWQYHKGDYVVYVNQVSNQYIINMLEPQGPDSFFAWNFFDGILMRKEYFSAYVFEDLAADILEKNPEIKSRLEAKKREDRDFAEDAHAQLEFVYQASPHYEKTHRMYPVGRVVKSHDL